MTAQEKKSTKWINLNSVITTVCTAVLIYVGAGVSKLYKQLSNQPNIDEKQTTAIVSLINENKEQGEAIKNHEKSIIKLEAILPDPNQFKVK